MKTCPHSFQVIRLWEENTPQFFHHPGLLPFAILSNTDDPEQVLSLVSRSLETISDDILQVIHRSNSNEQNGRNSEIPLYDQLHQANVCIICDRFITGTADLNWIKKNTLIQHKARLFHR